MTDVSKAEMAATQTLLDGMHRADESRSLRAHRSLLHFLLRQRIHQALRGLGVCVVCAEQLLPAS